MLTAILLVTLVSGTAAQEDSWKKVNPGARFLHDLENVPLYIETNSDNELAISTYTTFGNLAGSIRISTRQNYKLSFCKNSWTPLPVAVPTTQKKVWKISKTSGPRIVVTCNSKEVLNVLLSDTTCSWGSWFMYWGRDVGKVSISDTSASSYYCSKDCVDPVNGGWGDWGAWNDCSSTCAGGKQDRTRNCNNPTPEGSGTYCVGGSTDSQSCNDDIGCPVDGGWSDFSTWSECSKECGGGENSRIRTCTNPAPANGGAKCTGDEMESQSCNADPCPVDGGWSDFSTWSECSKECGGGENSRIRTCTNPAPANGGAKCTGDEKESQSCNADPCPVDGGWTDFTSWSDCSVECGEGTKTRSRTCTNPIPGIGGAECTGDAEESQTCTLDPCPVDGGWTLYTLFRPCNVRCGGGTEIWRRTCDAPLPAHGGKDCVGSPYSTSRCNRHPC